MIGKQNYWGHQIMLLDIHGTMFSNRQFWNHKYDELITKNGHECGGPILKNKRIKQYCCYELSQQQIKNIFDCIQLTYIEESKINYFKNIDTAGCQAGTLTVVKVAASPRRWPRPPTAAIDATTAAKYFLL